MQMSMIGRALTRASEGLRLAAYSDGAGVPTLGYGHTAGVRLGDTCSEAEAEAWLGADLEVAAAAVSRLVTGTLAQGEFDALCDFCFNLGAGALGGSTLLRRLNAGDRAGAGLEFARWVHDGLGRVEPGLVVRRARERQLFESGAWT